MSDPTSLPNFPPPSDESPLRGRVLDVLQDQGFRPELDDDGDVSYKVEGQQLFVRCMEGEGQLPMMRVFGQWAIGDDMPQDVEKQLLAANDVTLSLNIIKTGIAGGTLVVTGEHLIFPGADLNMLIGSTTQMVLQAVNMWHQAIMSDGPHAALAGPEDMGPGADGGASGEPGPEAPGEGPR